MTGPAAPKPLPALRDELQLIKGAPSAAGEPAWLLYDPVSNRFVQIDFAMYHVLLHWRGCATVDDLVGSVNDGQIVTLDVPAVEQAVAFLHANRLTADPPAGGWRHFARESEAGTSSLLSALLHNYLFFRIPLFKPQMFLGATLPSVRRLASLPVRLVVGLLGLVGLYLASREWDVFVASIEGYFTWEGALLVGMALAAVKAAHELGHAYTAAHYGCRVHTMGVAFVLMAPLLYTDVTDAWRLRDRRKRLAIDSAGIKVEFAVAAIALFLWAFLPEGPLRGVAFTLSVVSIASSLVINLNPFMRFDGYYLLADCIGVDNLQSRAFAFGRWKLREWLFGLGDPPPETLPRGLAAGLVAYAWATWIYRIALFIGIALIVYHYFFKVLGILLFAVEIIFFVGRPIMNELRNWYRERGRILRNPRTAVTFAVIGLAAGVSVVPLSTRVEIPAMAESGQVQPIHPGRASRVVEVAVRQGEPVRKGDVLAHLEAPDVEHQIRQARTELARARLQFGRTAADLVDRSQSLVLQSTIGSLQARLKGLERERGELILRAPFDGRVVELDPALTVGRWVNPRNVIAVVATDTGFTVRGYVQADDRWRIAQGATGVFVPEAPARRSVAVRIDRVADAAAADIELAALASTNAGRIAVTPDARKRLVPQSAHFLVNLAAVSPEDTAAIAMRGVVIAEGSAESLLARVWRRTLKVLVRESGV